LIDFNEASLPASAPRYDLDLIAARLRDTALSWVPQLFPRGRRQGDEWRLANIRGDAPRDSGSCVIQLVGERAGDWHDFDGNQGGGPLSTLEHGTGLSGRALFSDAAERVGWTADGPAREEPPAARAPRDVGRDIRFILEQAVPVGGTVGEAYLRQRGLMTAGTDLLFHADLANFETKAGYPGLVGLVRDVAGDVIALHRTYLHQDGDGVRKAPIPKPRMMLGKTGGGAVRLAPINAHGMLGLCEGIETGLAVMGACPGLPVWSTLSTAGLEQVQLPVEARCLVILADHDASGAGLRSAEALAARLRLEGRIVSIATPPTQGDDFNDLLRTSGSAAIAALVDAAMRPVSEPMPAPALPDLAAQQLHLPLGFAASGAPRPIMRADEGDLERAADRAWNLVLGSNEMPWLFRLGGVPSWVISDDEGRPVAAAITEERLRLMLAKLADWRKVTAKGDALSAPPPSGVVKALLATPNPRLPVLAGIATTPVFGRAGILLTEPGYHPDARLLYQPLPGFRLAAVSPQPSEAEVVAARSLLLEDLLVDFPFTGPAERAHAVALLLLNFVRPMIEGPTPLHLIEKPSPGTGATLMVDAIATILTGVGASVMTEGRDDEEWRKRLTAKLRQIPSLILIDNLREELDSSAVAAALTAPFWEDRILGQSDMTRLPIRCAWVATGNNPTFSNEMARRLVRIRLDARSDEPWRRGGFRHADLMAWVRAHMGRLVHSCLTLCQAWIAAGRPRGQASLGSYESWAQTIGGILNVAGIDGFLGNLDEMMAASDVEGAPWRAFIKTWWDRFGTAEVTTSDLIGMARNVEPALPISAKDEQGQKIRLGRGLAKLRDRAFRIGARLLHLRHGAVTHGAQRWKLVLAPAGSPEISSPSSPDQRQVGEDVAAHGPILPQSSPAESRRFPPKREDGEEGEDISTPYTRTHTHAHPYWRRAEKFSPSSPSSPSPENPPLSGGEDARTVIPNPPHPPRPPSWLDGVP
jgi:putative DNA primase/helicase